MRCDNERPCASCRRIGASCSSKPVATTAGFDPASLAILAKLDEIQHELTRLPGRPQSHTQSSATFSQDSSPLDPPRLEHHLQRGNVDQVLAWDIWNPHTDAISGDLEQKNIESPSRSGQSDQTLDIAPWNAYLNAFFHNVHVLNPVLDETRIRSQLMNVFLHGIGWDPPSCLLLLVLASGAASSPLGAIDERTSAQREESWSSAQSLFAAAEKRKDLLWRSDYLTQARCHFYTGVFMMISMRPFDAWRAFLLGLATCQRLTGSRGNNSADNPTSSHAEESIYWSCWKSERELRFELDVPDFGAAGYDHPILYPTLPSEISDQEHLRAWYFYLAEISLWRFEMTARQTMGEYVRQPSCSVDALADRTVDLELSLATWQDSIPDTLRLDRESVDGVDSDVLLFVLKGRLTYNYEVLTWPFLETLLLFGPHTSENASALAARGISLHYERLLINRPGFYHRHHGTWLMQRSSARSACVLLAIAKSTSSDLLPTDWQGLVYDTISMLVYWCESPQNEFIKFLKSIYQEVAE